MNKEQAFAIVSKLCMMVSATRQEHQMIDQALELLKPAEQGE